MSDLSSLALPHVAKLHPYTPGIQPTESGWVKLNTNECPYGPSPHVAVALRREIGEDGASLRLYPNPKSSPLRAAIAQHHGHGLTAENVIVGNGSDDILNLLVRAFCTREAAAGFTFPSYSLYPVLVEIQDGQSNVIAFDRAMKLPIERIAASKARAFFLTSPNAPTGVALINRTLYVVDNAAVVRSINLATFAAAAFAGGGSAGGTAAGSADGIGSAATFATLDRTLPLIVRPITFSAHFTWAWLFRLTPAAA
jgi:histidinol-phosphate aminotransferase